MSFDYTVTLAHVNEHLKLIIQDSVIRRYFTEGKSVEIFMMSTNAGDLSLRAHTNALFRALI